MLGTPVPGEVEQGLLVVPAEIEIAHRRHDEITRHRRLGDDLTLGGLVELEWTRKDNYDLDDARAADRTDWNLAARLETVWGG